MSALPLIRVRKCLRLNGHRSLSLSLPAYRSKTETSAGRFGAGVAIGSGQRRACSSRTTERGVVISGKHRKDRAAFSITGTRSLLSCRPQKNVPVTTSPRKGNSGTSETKGTSSPPPKARQFRPESSAAFLKRHA